MMHPFGGDHEKPKLVAHRAPIWFAIWHSQEASANNFCVAYPIDKTAIFVLLGRASEKTTTLVSFIFRPKNSCPGTCKGRGITEKSPVREALATKKHRAGVRSLRTTRAEPLQYALRRFGPTSPRAEARLFLRPSTQTGRP